MSSTAPNAISHSISAEYSLRGKFRDCQPMDTPTDPQHLEGSPVRPGTKLAALVMVLRSPQGATSLQLMLATAWQPHTVRGAISGLLRKKLGLNVVLAHNDSGERVYRVV